MVELAGVLSSTGAIPPGTRLGKYEVLDRIGGGGMAEIYMARAHEAGGVTQLAVIKRILPHLARDPDFIRMFLNEAKITASLDHPNIAHVKEVGRAGEEFFLALELIHGVDVRRLLKASAARGGVPLGPALTMVGAVANALHYAHGRSIVHRDVTPSNIMVTYEGHAKVLDFGIAKAALTAMTRAGTIKGKVGYMSPEQCMAEVVDRRSDVFALGILLYELTLGRKLFKGDSDFAIMNQITLGRIVPPTRVDPTYPAELERIVLEALAVDPNDRFQSAQDLADALEDFAHAAQVRISPSGVAEWMKELLGDPPPVHAGPPRSPPSADAIVVATTWSLPGVRRKNRSVSIGLVAGAIGIAIGGVAVGLLRDGSEPAVAAPPPPVVVPAPVQATPETVAAGALEAAPEPASASADEPAQAQPASEASEPSSKPATRRPADRRRRKGSRKKKTPAPSSSLLPPSRGGARK